MAEHNVGQFEKEQLQEVEAQLKDLKARWPAHSVKPAMLSQLEDLEEKRDRLRRLGTVQYKFNGGIVVINYQFTFNDKTYELGEDNYSYLMNDEEHPVAGIEIPDILELLDQAEEVNFDLKYYGQPCQNCRAGKEEKAKFFKFLEYHFYIFTKTGEYVMSSLSKEFADTSFTKLARGGKIDNSYIVSVIVCINCGEYSVEIEQCDV